MTPPSAARPLRLGLNLPYTEGQLAGATPRWSDIRDLALTAEAVGFDAVWISDHVGFGDPVTDEPGAWSGAWESWTLLSALAEATTRIELGTYVLCTPFRNPALLAKMAETLDEVSGGRLILGLGAGWNEAEFASYGFPYAERFDRFEDSLRIIAALLRTGRANYLGRHARADHARLAPRGPRPGGLPIMVGAHGPRLLRLTAELADHWNGGLASIAETAEALAALAAACAAVERDPATLRRSVEVLVRTIPAGPATPPDERELGGSSHDIAAGLARYADLGIDELQVQLRPNDRASVEAFGPVLVALGYSRASRPSRTATQDGVGHG